jgi:O-antigen biosynthesis protein
MKIAFVIPINGISGGLFVAYRHAHHLAEQGHAVEFLVVNPLYGTTITSYPGFQLPVKTLSDAMEQRLTYDVTIATWWETFYEMFRVPARHRVYFCQSDERRFYPSVTSPEIAFVELTYSDSNVGIITEARWIRSWLSKEFGVTAQYAPNGIDPSWFHPGVPPREPKGERVRVLIEGPGGQPFKRIDLAFRVTEKIPNIEVWYVSSDGYRKPEWRCDRMLSGLKLSEMPAVYTACDLLLKLSTVEGFFGPPLEMMASGGTAVVSRATGWDEYVVDEKNALCVELDDLPGAVEALNRLVNDKTLREKLSKNGIKTAKQLDWKKQCPKFEKALLNLVELDLTTPRAPLYPVIHGLRQNLLDQEIRLKRLEKWKPSRLWQKVTESVRGGRVDSGEA